MVKVKLLTDGGYDSLKHIHFPQVVKGYQIKNRMWHIPIDELQKIGFNWDMALFGGLPDCCEDDTYLSFYEYEAEEVK